VQVEVAMQQVQQVVCPGIHSCGCTSHLLHLCCVPAFAPAVAATTVSAAATMTAAVVAMSLLGYHHLPLCSPPTHRSSSTSHHLLTCSTAPTLGHRLAPVGGGP
jgi:hypothetical protein